MADTSSPDTGASNSKSEGSLLGQARDAGITFAVAAAALSGLTYALIYSAYSLFYSRFGTNPEEAGLDRNAIFSQALLLPLFGLGFEFLCYAILLIVTASVGVIIAGLAASIVRREPPGHLIPAMFNVVIRVLRRKRVILGLALVIALLAGTSVYSQMRRQADHAAANARRGELFSWVQTRFQSPLVHFGWSPTFEMKLRSEAVDVAWTRSPGAFPEYSRCLLLLGEPSATSLVYDVQTQILWRIPTKNATFRTRLGDSPENPDRCLPTHVKATRPEENRPGIATVTWTPPFGTDQGVTLDAYTVQVYGGDKLDDSVTCYVGSDAGPRCRSLRSSMSLTLTHVDRGERYTFRVAANYKLSNDENVISITGRSAASDALEANALAS